MMSLINKKRDASNYLLDTALIVLYLLVTIYLDAESKYKTDFLM